MTIKDFYPLPIVDECIDYFIDAKIFTTLDADNVCLKLYITAKGRHKTSFVRHKGTNQHIWIKLCLINAPGTYQHDLYMVLTKFKCKSCLVYID